MLALLIVAFIILNEKTEHQRKSNVIGDVAAMQIHLADECANKELYLGNIAANNQHFVNAVKMGKVSHADKMRMQTLREQGCAANAIIRAYPYKEWKLSLSRTASS